MSGYQLKRFLDAQDADYAAALQEIKTGRKRSHWMWYIFPQIAGLGMSGISQHYAIADLQEAKEYMENPLLKAHMLEIKEKGVCEIAEGIWRPIASGGNKLQ